MGPRDFQARRHSSQEEAQASGDRDPLLVTRTPSDTDEWAEEADAAPTVSPGSRRNWEDDTVEQGEDAINQGNTGFPIPIDQSITEQAPPDDDPPLPPIEVRPPCPVCEPRRRYQREKSRNALYIKSKMDEPTFFQTPASYCYVPMDTQLDLMSRALRIAKEALWHAMRDHWPDECYKLWFESAEEVLFGNDDIGRTFDSIKGHLSFAKTRCVPDFDARLVVELRNAVCHPKHRETYFVDVEIRRAQELVLEIQDEPRALAVRKIREELQAEAKKTLRQIEEHANDTAKAIRAFNWPRHIERFFMDLTKLDPKLQATNIRYNYGNVSEEVRQVWRAYKGYAKEADVPDDKVKW